MSALATAQAKEPVREDAAVEEGIELVLDELRQACGGGLLGLGEEGLGAVQRVLLGPVALVVDGRAIGRTGDAADRWLARAAPEVMSSGGLKLYYASQSPSRAPTCGCPPTCACPNPAGAPTGEAGFPGGRGADPARPKDAKIEPE